MSTTRAELLRPLSEASLLTVTQAVREIGGRASETRTWLRDQGLVLRGRLGERVRWGDVLAAWEREAERPAAVPAKAGRLPRTPLGR